LISTADIAVSMLPAAFHTTIATFCLELNKHLVTPSYISDKMQSLHDEVAAKGLVFMNEVGLDPGIDHISALQLLDKLRAEGNVITAFKSHCGGLIAPESDDNPWHYKFTWNPRNVILAGQGEGGIKYKQNGAIRELHYEQLFASATELKVPGYGVFESYPNRDSLKYESAYGLETAHTIYRGTLRVPPFCAGWQLLVNCGLTDDKTEIDNLSSLSYKNFFEKMSKTVLSEANEDLLILLNSVFDDDTMIPFKKATPATVLQSVLEKKWRMKESDKDMVVMVHEVHYENQGSHKGIQSSFIYKGKDSVHTAMAITVGLPLAIVVKMILKKQINRKGVLLPVYPDIYNPVLAELKSNGISFHEVPTNIR
jgi:saccharopine dehydrogenase (NAD+, L-glutamate forming)